MKIKRGLNLIGKNVAITLIFSVIFLINTAIAQDTPISAEEAGNRIIKLAKTVKSKKDISPKNIALQMQAKVEFNDQDRNTYEFAGNIKDSTWVYWLTAYPYPSKNNKKLRQFALNSKIKLTKKPILKQFALLNPKLIKKNWKA